VAQVQRLLDQAPELANCSPWPGFDGRPLEGRLRRMRMASTAEQANR
jgi:hypothetical protein